MGSMPVQETVQGGGKSEEEKEEEEGGGGDEDEVGLQMQDDGTRYITWHHVISHYDSFHAHVTYPITSHSISFHSIMFHPILLHYITSLTFLKCSSHQGSR